MKKMLLLFFTILSLTGIDITAMNKARQVAKLDNLDKFAASVNTLTNQEVAELIEVLLASGVDSQHFTKPIEQQKINLVIATIHRKQIPYQADIQTLLLVIEYGSFAQDHCIRWVQFLLSHGLNVNASVKKWIMLGVRLENITPLAFIAHLLGEANSQKETLVKIAKILLQQGADPNHKFKTVNIKGKIFYNATPITLTQVIANTQPEPNKPEFNASIQYAKQMLPMLKNPALANEKPTYMNYRALMKAAAATLGVYAVYHWITNKWNKAEPGQHNDILINKTGQKIVLEHDNGDSKNQIQLKADETFDLPMNGILTITDELSKKSLEINLDQYQTERTKRHLNLIISKNWLSWWFGPFKKTENWIAHN